MFGESSVDQLADERSGLDDVLALAQREEAARATFGDEALPAERQSQPIRQQHLHPDAFGLRGEKADAAVQSRPQRVRLTQVAR